MRRRMHLSGAGVLAAVLALLCLAPAAAQSLKISAEATTEVGDVLRQGRQLEVENRWGEALTHYEDALRQYPDDPSLKRRFQFSRLHYDVARRCDDRSFGEMVSRISCSEALDVYAEVLLKIQSHYVEAPNWKELVERGTNSFEVALSEPSFLRRHAPTADDESLTSFRFELRRALGPKVIQSRADARDAVATAAGLADSRLGIRPNVVVLEYTCGAAGSLDVYSTYLTPGQLADIHAQIKGNFVGLGVELKADGGALLIVRVIPDSPAKQGGIRAGDRITSVDGQSTRELNTDQAANLLQGTEGSLVDLTVATPGQPPRRITVRRDRITVPSIEGACILAPGVAYFKLVCFQETTSQHLDAALWKLHRAGMRSLIFDLRDNPGGVLGTAVEVTDRFIDEGILVSTRGRNAQEDATYSAHKLGTWRVPLVVMIDEDSASAAEIFAGAIRDHRRGTIVGSRSYGKGSVQGIFPLSLTGAGVRLTTSRFYSPHGRPYSQVGVEPDVTVHHALRPTAGSLSSDNDPVLTQALEVAQRLMAARRARTKAKG
ncbi:MAG: S41 family peptidase [Planctomycetota bacterium]